MKILVFPSWYANETSSASNGSFFKEQAIGLKKCGFEVAVASVDFNGRRILKTKPSTLFFPIVVRDEGILTYRVNGVHLIYSCPELVKRIWSRMFERLYKVYIRDHGKPDLIIAHSYWAGYAASKIKEKFSVPYILVEHVSTVLRKIIPRWQIKYLQESYKCADKVCAVSSALSKSMSDLVPCISEIEIVPNFIDTNLFSGKIASINTQVILAVGHLHKGKNFDLLINAFIESEAYHSGWSLRIGGDGFEMKNLVKIKTEKDKLNSISLLGRLSRKNVFEEMRKASVFVCSSQFETFSVVLIEALSMGVPLISTKCGGPEDIVNNKNGILVDVGSRESMTNGINKMIKNRENYDSFILRKQAKEKFSIDEVSLKYKSMIGEILLS